MAQTWTILNNFQCVPPLLGSWRRHCLVDLSILFITLYINKPVIPTSTIQMFCGRIQEVNTSLKNHYFSIVVWKTKPKRNTYIYKEALLFNLVYMHCNMDVIITLSGRPEMLGPYSNLCFQTSWKMGWKQICRKTSEWYCCQQVIYFNATLMLDVEMYITKDIYLWKYMLRINKFSSVVLAFNNKPRPIEFSKAFITI